MELFGIALSSAELSALWQRTLDFTGPRWVPSLTTVLAGGLLYLVARTVIGRFVKRWAAKTKTQLDDYAAHFVHSAVVISCFAWVAWRLADIWSLGPASTWIQAIWIAILFFPLSRLAGDALTVIETEVTSRTETPLDETAFPMVNKGTRIAIIGIGIIVGLSEMGVNIAPVLAGASVLGLALSLAAKDTLSNLIAGVLLIIDRPFKVGDRIELWTAPTETGTWGDVVEIGLRATKIRNPDNLLVVVPNNEIMQRDIVNYTMSGEHIRLRIPFSVAYESEIERAKVLLAALALETEGVKTDPEPIVIVRGFGPSEVNLQLRVWINEARLRRRIADQITERAVIALEDAGIEIPYPKRELFIRSESSTGAGGPAEA